MTAPAARVPGRKHCWIAISLALAALGLSGCAITQPVPPTTPQSPAAQNTSSASTPATDRSEQIRNVCLAGRRVICGRVIDIEKDGYVIESGYTSLLHEPFTRSWVVTGNIAASREPNGLEANVPGTPCIGTVFLTLDDLPKTPVVHKYDYILSLAFPAGHYDYAPVPPVTNSLRKFTRTLERAVIVNLKAENSQSP
jgi:hypothetical protein